VVSRGLLLALIGGIASVFLTIIAVGPAPIIAVGFYLGSAYAGISAGIAAMLILLNLDSGSTFYYIVGTGVPALILVRQAMISQPGTDPGSVDWYPPGQVLAWLTVYGVAVLACIAVYFSTTGHTLETVSRDILLKIAGMFTDSANVRYRSDADRAVVKQLWDDSARETAKILAGFLISIILLKIVIIATTTQGMLNRAGVALRPSPSYVALELPRWLTAMLAVALLLSLLPGSLGSFGRNAALFLSTPFFLLGLTVIHTLSRRSLKPGSVLSAFYMGLFLVAALIKPALALLVLLGIGEQWFSLRQRLAAPGSNQEDE
jgi:hypothetical protein